MVWDGPDIGLGAGFVDAVALAFSRLSLADANGVGLVDARDVLVVPSWHAAGDRRAHINGDGLVDSRDVLAFLDLWNQGCD